MAAESDKPGGGLRYVLVGLKAGKRLCTEGRNAQRSNVRFQVERQVEY